MTALVPLHFQNAEEKSTWLNLVTYRVMKWAEHWRQAKDSPNHSLLASVNLLHPDKGLQSMSLLDMDDMDEIDIETEYAIQKLPKNLQLLLWFYYVEKKNKQLTCLEIGVDRKSFNSLNDQALAFVFGRTSDSTLEFWRHLSV